MKLCVHRGRCVWGTSNVRGVHRPIFSCAHLPAHLFQGYIYDAFNADDSCQKVEDEEGERGGSS